MLAEINHLSAIRALVDGYKAPKKSSRPAGRASLRCFLRCMSVKEGIRRLRILHVQNRYVNASASGVSPSKKDTVSLTAAPVAKMWPMTAATLLREVLSVG